MGSGPYRLVVRSIGAAGIGLVRSLRRVLPFSEAEVAALLLQAPSTLLTGLDRAKAEALAGFLTENGLDCAALDGDAAVEDGIGDHELALTVVDPARLAAVVLEVVRLLGVDVQTARGLVCGAPAVLLGGVSLATVDALRARFEPLGATLDASHAASARFDVYLGECPAPLRDRALARLAAFGETGDGAVLGLDHSTAARAFAALRALDVPARVINRDFARYDVRLQAATDTPALRAHLEERARMPAAVIPKVLARLPVVIHGGLRHAETMAALAELAAAGAHATAEPIAFQRFALTLGEVREPRALVPLLCAIGGLEEAAAVGALHRRPARVPGPLTPTQARWLQHDLRRAGVEARLELL
ncbi:MAG: hypothetical protein R3F65_00855 [bacterium]|nr:hypothetical protein [Myxococcales bacterium]MCB9541303.1 hypothetical protein [Myxococcales bacterium]